MSAGVPVFYVAVIRPLGCAEFVLKIEALGCCGVEAKLKNAVLLILDRVGMVVCVMDWGARIASHDYSNVVQKER